MLPSALVARFHDDGAVKALRTLWAEVADVWCFELLLAPPGWRGRRRRLEGLLHDAKHLRACSFLDGLKATELEIAPARPFPRNAR